MAIFVMIILLMRVQYMQPADVKLYVLYNCIYIIVLWTIPSETLIV